VLCGIWVYIRPGFGNTSVYVLVSLDNGLGISFIFARQNEIMIELKLADPTPHELNEYRLLISELKDKFPGASVFVDRGAGEYAISNTTILIENDRRTETHSAIYPSVPNRGTAQIKADILALTFAMRELGFDIKFLDSDPVVREKVTITRGKLDSCVSLRQLVELLEEANHEKLDEVKILIENKRKNGGRPSKKSVIEFIFSGAKEEKRAQPVRTGPEWARVKMEWRDKFPASKYAKIYKSLDEFCTFATEEECK
jgi:hypothetical protein